MRISKESIFTGFNNLKVLSITDERYDEYFGFTDMEVKNMLEYYGMEEHYEEAKSWYDGYQFGSVEVYCPWDVLNYCDKLKDHADSFPENYRINTSGNDAVKKFIQMSGNFKTKREIETLLAGEEIIKEIHQELVYPEMYQSLENVWSLLFMTGYLTQRGRVDAQACERALQQIEEKKYDEELRENGVNKILKYGIACYMKRCKVKQAEKLS